MTTARLFEQPQRTTLDEMIASSSCHFPTCTRCERLTRSLHRRMYRRSPPRHVLSPLESRSDRETDSVALLQQVVKELIVGEIRLESNGEVSSNVEFQAAAEPIEVGPVRFFSRRRELVYHKLGDGVGRTR